MKKAVLSKKWQSNEVTKSTVQNVFKWFCQTWRDQKKPESDRYYEYKSKNEGLSDDELDQKQMEKQFPDYSGWFHAQSLGTEELEMETANDLKGSMEFLKVCVILDA